MSYTLFLICTYVLYVMVIADMQENKENTFFLKFTHSTVLKPTCLIGGDLHVSIG